MDVRLVDLARLHAPIRTEIDAAIAQVIDSGRFILGAEVEAFEHAIAAHLDVPFAVGLSSGSDAILCALWADGVGPGDEVITPAFSFTAAAEAIMRVGAKPVFVDVGEDLNIDVESVKSRITARTRAILAVDLFGRRARFDVLAKLGVPLIEDAAQAIGSGLGRDVRAAALSFFPTKNLGALGDGGLLVTANEAIANDARRLRAHGATRKYVHERVGWNMRLDALQASVLRVKLARLAGWNASRARIAEVYREKLASVGIERLSLPSATPHHVWHQFVVCARQRDALRTFLSTRGVETEVYYPLALHVQPCFAHLGGRTGEHPRAERATREALAIPIHPMLTDAEIAHVADSVRAFFD